MSGGDQVIPAGIPKEQGKAEELQARLALMEDTYRAILNILEDVETERENAERAKTLLESTNRELEAFSYSVSHDLRAPLRAISGFSEAVIEDYGPVVGDEGKRYLKLIADNANRMGQLIDDLLTFSRLGRQQVRRTEVDLTAMAREVSGEFLAQSGNRDIRFLIGDVPHVSGDRAMLRQVLVNLFSNAVKFTGNAGTALIEFGCRKDEKKQDVFYVRDNGVGFDMRYIDKLFGVFQRLHSAKAFEGTGVGLALVNRIITRHGGRVWAEGEVNRGATFYFTVPGKPARRDSP